MTLILRQSTARTIRIGPFMDATTGVDPEVGITLASADQAEVLKHDGAATVTMAGTFTAITGSDGWYDYIAAVGDVDTVGEVVFVVQDSSVCLPVFVRGYVIEEAIYDDLYVAAATGYNSTTPPTVAAIATQVLTTHQMPELSVGIPDATPSVEAALMLVYQALRNELKTTATLKTISNDAGTVVAQATLAADATTFTKSEFVSG